MRRVLPLLVLLLLGACAERWTRPGTTEAEADATNAACGDQAVLAVPQQLVWTVVESGGYDRERHCRHVQGREHCYYTTRWRPPRYGWVDANAQPREAWRRSCMRDRGFTFEGYRPLRLQ
jgi:hypothetical protein